MKPLKWLGKDPMRTMAVITVGACTLKFLMEGVTATIGGYSFSLGHADAMTYAALLTPVLGAHSYTRVKGPPTPEDQDGDGVPDKEQK